MIWAPRHSFKGVSCVADLIGILEVLVLVDGGKLESLEINPNTTYKWWQLQESKPDHTVWRVSFASSPLHHPPPTPPPLQIKQKRRKISLTGRQLMKNSYLCWSSACSKSISLKTVPPGDRNLWTITNSLLSRERVLRPQSVLPE